MLKLIIEDDEGRKTVVPFVRDEITIGRLEGNTIRLTERNVSRRHARLLRQNGHVLVEDLGSYNGIRVNGDRIKGQVQVQDGDLIQIGDYDLAIQNEEEKATAPTVPLEGPAKRSGSSGKNPAHVPSGGTGKHQALRPTVKDIATSETMPSLRAVGDLPEAADDDIEEAADEDISPALGDEPPSLPKNQTTAVIRIDQVEGAQGRKVETIDRAEAPRLVALTTEFAGKEFPLTRTEMRIGRIDDNDICIDHRSLSRTHCKVVREANGEWKVVDLQSANGIMVNGEQYAQSTLGPGDTLELGHLKLRFALPGEEVEIPPSRSAETRDLEPGGLGAKAPIIAVAAAVAVLVLGGGGYVIWRSRQPPDKPVTAPPRAVKGPKAGNTVTPPTEDPEAVKQANEKRLAEARTAIEALDFEAAESLLKQTTVDGKLHPQAKQLLDHMDQDRGKKVALENAKAALDEGDLDGAKTNLDTAAGSKLLGKPFRELQERYTAALKQVMAKNAVRPTGPAPDPAALRKKALEAELDRVMQEARADKKANRLKAAINRLETKCLTRDPNAYACHMLLGSYYATMGTQENNGAAVKKGLQHYQKFLDTAPPDNPNLDRVREFIKAYEAGKKPQ